MTPTLTLEEAIDEVKQAKAAYIEDVTSVFDIKNNIAAATAPLKPAQDHMAISKQKYLDAMKVLDSVIASNTTDLNSVE